MLARTVVTPNMLARMRSADAGFTLIEVVIALALTVIVMTSTAAFFVHSLSATKLMQQRQAAAGVAEQAMERVRAEPVANLVGRATSTVRGGDTLTSTTDPAYRVGNTDFEVQTQVQDCWIAPGGTACGTDATAPNHLMHRVRVTVSWMPKGAGSKCSSRSGLCSYRVSTLRDSAESMADRINEVPTP